jgi:hypothetical protein
MIFLFLTAFYQSSYISTIAILHDNVYFCLLAVYYSVIVLDYIWMPKLAQYVHLRYDHLLLFL